MPARCTAPVLWGLVALQLAIPASYYLRGSQQDDERFAWRMFSDVRFRACEVQAFERSRAAEPEQPLQLEHALHASWAGLLRRGRPAVIEAFLRDRCGRGRLAAVRLRRSCTEIAHSAGFRQSYELECATGRLLLQQERP